MPVKKVTKITTVREHPMHVTPSKSNPTGLTIRHQHPRRIYDSINSDEIKSVFENYNKKKIIYPAKGRLLEFKTSDDYDDLIAVWCDYFNKKFPPTPPLSTLDPNVLKALIASESGFIENPRNRLAFGITQITASTLKILQDPDSEAKQYLFKDIRQKDLKDPQIAIPMMTRWIFRKKEIAAVKLKRQPTPEEIILEYKGLLKSKSLYRNNAINNFKDAYEKLSAK